MSFQAMAWARDPEAEMLDLCTEDKLQEFAQHAPACESPIERIALAALLAMSACKVAKADEEIPEREKWEIVVVPQAKSAPYRLDFALIGEGGVVHALECDGREFHQDHSADNRRALALARRGIRVHRVSGASLYRDPIRTLEPIIDIVKGRA